MCAIQYSILLVLFLCNINLILLGSYIQAKISFLAPQVTYYEIQHMIMKAENEKMREMLELLEIEKAYKDGMLSRSEKWYIYSMYKIINNCHDATVSCKL